jgi:hypothetical protein
MIDEEQKERRCRHLSALNTMDVRGLKERRCPGKWKRRRLPLPFVCKQRGLACTDSVPDVSFRQSKVEQKSKPKMGGRRPTETGSTKV